jgi:hypothetical protein
MIGAALVLLAFLIAAYFVVPFAVTAGRRFLGPKEPPKEPWE